MCISAVAACMALVCPTSWFSLSPTSENCSLVCSRLVNSSCPLDTRSIQPRPNVTAVDTARQTVSLVYTSGWLTGQPGGTVAMSACRLTTDPYQQSVPVGPIWDL